MLNKVLLEGRVTNILKGSISIKNNNFEMDILIPEEITDVPFKKDSHIFIIGFVDEFGIKAVSIRYIGEFRLKKFENLFTLIEENEKDYELDPFTDIERNEMKKELEELKNKRKEKTTRS